MAALIVLGIMLGIVAFIAGIVWLSSLDDAKHPHLAAFFRAEARTTSAYYIYENQGAGLSKDYLDQLPGWDKLDNPDQ